MRVSVIDSSPATAPFGKADDDVLDPVFDEAGDLVHHFAAHYFGIKDLRLFDISARQAPMTHAGETPLIR